MHRKFGDQRLSGAEAVLDFAARFRDLFTLSKNCESHHFSARPFQVLLLRARHLDILIYMHGDFGDHRRGDAEVILNFVSKL